MKILVAEKISPAGLKVLNAQPGWEVAGPEKYAANPDARLAEADALIVRSAVYVDDRLLAKAPHLRVIGRAGVGVDNIDMDAATQRGILVMNTPGVSATAVAEHALGLMLSLARHIPRADQSTRAGKWEKKSLQGTELSGKTLGVIGLGRIGLELARRAQALGMKVVASDPYVSPASARHHNVELASLDDLYARSDYISLHLVATPQTAGMINAAALAKMKRGVRIVNCARGELIDEAALSVALQSRQVAGAALDVFAVEPPKESPLLALDNVVLTPHLGGSTEEAQEAVGYQIASQICEYLAHGIAQNAVNITSLTDVEYCEMKPYLELGEKLGSMLAQLLDGNLEEIRVSYAGLLANWKTELLRNATIAGVLNRGSAELVNLINAMHQAEQNGLQIFEERMPESENQANILSVALRSNAGDVSAQGTVVSRNQSPRIIQLNGIDIESPLAGDLIVLKNTDVPGVIGAVGTVLGNHGVNIARFALGREIDAAVAADASGIGMARRPTALAIVQTDVALNSGILDLLRKLPAVASVRPVAL